MRRNVRDRGKTGGTEATSGTRRAAAILAAACASLLLFCGCGYLEPGLPEYTLPETTDAEREVTEGSIEALINEEHEPPTLDPDWLAAQGYDPAAFETQSESVLAGIRAAEADYEEAEALFAFWSAVINDIDVDAMAADMYATAADFEESLQAQAAECGTSLAAYAAEVNLSDADLETFLNEAYAQMGAGCTAERLLADLEAGVSETYAALLNLLSEAAG